MTSDEKSRIEKALADFTRDAVASAEAAQLALAKTGIFTSDGLITPEYGGDVDRLHETKDATYSERRDEMNTLWPPGVNMSGAEAIAFRACIQHDNHNNTMILDRTLHEANYALACLQSRACLEIKAIGDDIRKALKE